MLFAKEEVENSLRTFKSRRDNLLHEDIETFDHHYERFLEFCNTDSLARGVLDPLDAKCTVDLDEWWAAATNYQPKLSFPPDRDMELALRYKIMHCVKARPDLIMSLGIAHQKGEMNAQVELFRTLIVRPFVEDLSSRLGEAANLATPEARAVQAVPLFRIPASTETRIFLSHKSLDKPLVYRYHLALKLVGFDPWLDEPNMPAGSNLERELLRGFEESCAAVFFVTDNFRDENYLATEVEYAVSQKRKKGKKFSIITLRYSDASPIPPLLANYVYRKVSNDLEGFHDLVKALPIELGPIRWKADAV